MGTEPVGGGSGCIIPPLSSSRSPTHKVVKDSLALESGVRGVWGPWEANSGSCLKTRGGERRRERNPRLGRGGGLGRAGAPYSLPSPPNFPGVGGFGVWVWVLRKGNTLCPTPIPTPSLSSPNPVEPRASRRRCRGRSAGADRRARGKRLLGESPSPPKSPKLAATSKDARNLHLAL